MRLLAVILAAGVLAAAQTKDESTASIAGVVLEAVSGKPVPGAEVHNRQTSASQPVLRTTTDQQGRYQLTGLPPGKHQISLSLAPPPGQALPGGYMTKVVTVGAGQKLEHVDWSARTFARISGRVIDENKEPVPGLSLFAVTREFVLGTLRYVIAGAAHTDGDGAFTFSRIEPGRGYLIRAEKRPRVLPSISDVPADPKARVRATAATYYPGVPTIDAAEVLVLAPGEHRENVEIRMFRAPSLCIQGVIEGEGQHRFAIEPLWPTSGESGDGGMYAMPPGGITTPEGEFRVCGLVAGEYRVIGEQWTSVGGLISRGETPVRISRDDAVNVKVYLRPGISIPGEVVLDGRAPETPITTPVRFWGRPLARAGSAGSGAQPSSSIPGQFSFKDILSDAYRVDLHEIPAGWYVKAFTYGTANLLREPLNPSLATGNPSVRLVLAADGATITANVVDHDKNPVSDATILIVPTDAMPEASMAASLIAGQTDQNGAYTSESLAPGKYLVLAVDRARSNSYEYIHRVWEARSKAKEVELGPKASVQVTLEQLKFE